MHFDLQPAPRRNVGDCTHTSPLSTLQLPLRPAGDIPLCRQIVQQIQDAIADGRLNPHDPLQPARALAEQVAVCPATIQKAYDELECLGLIETTWTLR